MTKSVRSRSGYLLLFLFLWGAMLLLPSLSDGATAPSATRLVTVPNLNFPGFVASDSSGNVYVADYYAKNIYVFDYLGNEITEIPLPYRPTCIAVSPPGLSSPPSNSIFVGQDRGNGKSYIDSYSFSGQRTGRWDADGPSAMAFLSTGELFVLDRFVVKKYNSTMSSVTLQFGGAHIFKAPFAIAVNENRSEVYVLDNGNLVDTGGGKGTGAVWRVQVFDSGLGTLKSSFSKYGCQTNGYICEASGIAADESGRLYISDNLQSVVGVFDATSTPVGTWLSSIYDNSNQLYFISNLSFNKNSKRLNLLSTQVKFYTTYGIDSFSNMTVTPASVSTAWQPAMATPSSVLTLTNSGASSLTWNASVDAGSTSWLAVSRISGQLSASSSTSLSLTVNTAGLAAGQTYAGSVTITSQDAGSSITVPVEISIYGPPVLLVAPSSISVQRKSDETTSAIPLNITFGNDISGTLTWQASVTSGSSWLSVRPTEGAGGAATSVSIADGVSAGTYSGQVTVTLDGAIGSPVKVPVSLSVLQASKIIVTTNIDAATFTVTGPNGSIYYGSGKSYAINDPVNGSYDVTFNSVQGYKTPSSVNISSFAAPAVVTANGNYTDLRKQVKIVASRNEGQSDPSEIVIYNPDGTLYIGASGTPVDFTAFSSYMHGANTTLGDINNDGIMEILAGTAGTDNPAYIEAFDITGAPISSLALNPFGGTTGVHMAVADFAADGMKDIVAVDAAAPNTLKIFQYNGSAVSGPIATLSDPYAGLSAGMEVAVADVDGDGTPEIVVAPSAISSGYPYIKIYKVNTSGTWSLSQYGSDIQACADSSVGLHMTTGDVDSDGTAEIIVICQTSGGSSVVREFRAAGGSPIASFSTGSPNLDYLAAGDTNMDGNADIILGSSSSNMVRIFGPTGALMTSFSVSNWTSGVKVSAGSLGN